MPLSDSLREKLKVPLGTLVPDSQVSRNALYKLVHKGAYIISVGDRTTERLFEFGIMPSLHIVDCLEKRKRRAAPDAGRSMPNITCKNPPAEITRQSIDAIRRALALEPPVMITVDGEEDLLVVPACIHAPKGAIVLYGQPNEGMVIVPVTAEVRNKAQSILDSMS